MRASNRNINLSRKNIKIDEIIGKITSFILCFLMILFSINSNINNLEAKQNLVHSLFRNYKINNQICKKIKIIREGFNEIIEKKEKTNKQLLDEKNNNQENIIKSEENMLNKSSKIIF